ncbi:hypothetical protein [Flavihumibacter fluvii]|uniref:hypothetical protein n=1 Tax=Flavihumibacter fluvii TaxID=2838157 RepID=UPI001BDEF611|nr:hypothetical protein [Flavihumibacter fluvii]ULQ52279.1 hypothetical protein KJS93_19505 [Flavihumibacter fluvii]
MKKILRSIFPIVLLLAACTRQDISPGPPIDESYWLTRERGIIAYSDFSCNYFVIETYNGYTLARIWGGYAPSRGSIVYGDFSRYGVHTIYNRSEGYLMQADVLDYWLNYWDAIDQMDWNCSRP